MSLQTLSTNGQNQDMVSMGTASAWRGQQMLNVLKALLSIEIMVSLEAIRHREPQMKSPPSKQTSQWRQYVSPYFAPLAENRTLSA